jgi:hypothetical protein
MYRNIIRGALFVCLLVASMANAAGPNLLSYQGQVMTAGGVPVANGSYPAVFAFFQTPAGGSIIWSETGSITTSSGLFTHNLGSITAIPDGLFATNSSVWLDVTVNGQIQTPRTQMTSAGNALAVSTVDGATGGAITGDASVSGNFGVGTSTPNYGLDVQKSASNIFVASIVNSAFDGWGLEVRSNSTSASQALLDLYNASSNVFSIRASGSVGIGTSSPAAKLDVLNGNIRASSQLSSAGIEFYPASGGTPTNAGSIVGTGGSPNHIAILPVGNVGIGTGSPTSKLEVVGDLKVSGNIIGSTPWTPFPFAAGYNNYEDAHPGSGFQRVQYRKIGDIVYLRGMAHKADHAVIPLYAILGTLPVGFLPPATVRFITDPTSYIDIQQPSGAIVVGGAITEYRFLDGIIFSTTP